MISGGPRRLLAAGLTTAVTDGLFACVLSAGFHGSTVMRLWQGVASTLIGRTAFDGGVRTALLGVLMHFGVAFFWSALFYLLASRVRFVSRLLESRAGILAVAAIYGPMIWMVMSFLVIPSLVQRPPAVTLRWWIQLIGHVPFVGLPIAAWIGTGVRRPA